MDSLESQLPDCGIIIIDSHDRVLSVHGLLKRVLVPGALPGGGGHLSSLDLPAYILESLSHNCKIAIGSHKKRYMDLIVPWLDNLHVWSCVISPAPPSSGHPDVAVISIYDSGLMQATVNKGAMSLESLAITQVPLLPGSVLAVDGDTYAIMYMNSNASVSLGGGNELIGKKLQDILPDGSNELLGMFRQVALLKEPVIHTVTFSSEHSRPRYLRYLITARKENGRTDLVCTVVDFTEQMTNRFGELSTKLSEERYMLRTILETIPVGFIIADQVGQVWLSNATARDVFGQGVDDHRAFLSPGSQNKMWHPPWPDDFPINQAINEGRSTYAKTMNITTISGDEMVVLVSAVPMLDEKGVQIGAVTAFQDITEQKRAEELVTKRSEELDRSNAELQQFAYVASHDLQEPLRMVTSYLQLVERRNSGKLDEKSKEYMHYAVEGAMRMAGMINDILAYSRIGSRGEDFSQVNMEEVITVVLRDLKVIIGESGASITHDPLPTICADKNQMIILLENLTGNAIKYRGDVAPQIHISADEGPGECIFSVRDNGIGIENKYADQLFKMFRRLHTRDEYEGTGMGLAISRRIVERHHGRIWFTSEPGKGSTFYFSIPSTLCEEQ